MIAALKKCVGELSAEIDSQRAAAAAHATRSVLAPPPTAILVALNNRIRELERETEARTMIDEYIAARAHGDVEPTE